MNTFLRFFYEFLSVFFDGLFTGIKRMFDFKAYAKVINSYKDTFSNGEKIFLYIGVAILVIIILLVIGLIVLFIKKMIRKTDKNLNKDDLLNEINDLHDQVRKLMKEKEKIMAMKVSQLGLNPNEEENAEEQEKEDEKKTDPNIRFPKLVSIDEAYANYKVKKYNNSENLTEIIEDFRCFAASQLKLYYDYEILRPFFAGLACGKLIILQGISGTGKTSLAYAWGKFVNIDSCVVSVEPSWRDKSDFLGYFNEFTKKFTETKALGEIYTAGFDDNIHTIILDEMNLARVEYYFADLLSILEMPNKDEWIIELVPNSWKSDPKNIHGGKLKIPANMWYIGTINNDDSTFMVTDKVYDRAMPIDINDKGKAFKPIDTEAQDINYSYLNNLFETAMQENQISQDTLDKIELMDDYVIRHFRIAFGNRIVSHMKKFVPVFVACGGDEIAGVDYFIAKKILRKFEQLNIAYIRDEIDPYVEFLDKTFGKNKMKECIEYLLRLKKLT